MEPFVCGVVQGAVVEGVINGFRVGTMHLILGSLNGQGFTAVEIVMSREEMLDWAGLLTSVGSSVPPLQQQIDRKNKLAVADAVAGEGNTDA
jgi:hypothetical protein